ncbi:uncharacterized protein LOC115722871 isoform X1 [Cannabis sativa]|uniref:Uncharacterized protein n=3 Tax=Cannabis sativa TaxID=3483 RepID=A0AB40EBV5_CANSA|nr:uncharacterized protein LOC115722871 isoform X1 [Cannabis sativa]XP_030508078.1 uncharacterized protein LOC115722871 isoform X1 [Cannabis sativa]XP_060960072.1 uncharacterized protein LOC115722871 isoform X1 [Cannabis sativa]KAF4391463.1 hypothetical protein G4B88_005534 [Cannabis sativa]
MNHFSFQQNAFMAREEIRGGSGSTFASDPMDPVVCPRPRRVGILASNFVKSLRLQINPLSEFCDSKAGADLLDMILMKEDYGAEQSIAQVASSPPFFCGSPPSRAANPVVHDARFREEKLVPVHGFPYPSPSGLSSPSSSARKGGCVRMKFGPNPAAVRVEGFDCLNRDRQNSSIPAMA